MNHFERRRKALFIKGSYDDVEKIIKIAKNEAVKLGMRGRITVLEIGHYNPLLNGQAVIVEEAGGEYRAPRWREQELKINER